MTTSDRLLQDAEIAQAAYASGLSAGMPDDGLRDQLANTADFTVAQATAFSDRVSVVLQYNDTFAEGGLDTGLSLTVFRDRAMNALTLGIRGTSPSDPRDLATDLDIFAAGVGFDQIVAMFNWWQRASTDAGSVPQYLFVRTNELYPDALPVQGGYLARTHDASATGELVTALAAAGGKVDVTGHSLGGHLAMAFQALFGAQTGAVTVFNAPGFLVNGENTAFFKALGGPSSGVPAGDVPGLFNVVADHTSAADVPFQGIAMLHSQPGLAVDVAIENQWNTDEPEPETGSWNHSQMVLTDALAVQARLERLQPGLTHAQMSSLLAQAANQEHAGLERVVDALQALLGIPTAPLPTGHDQREALYLALKGIDEHPALTAIAGNVNLTPTFDPQAARTDFAALLSLTLGLPIQVRTDDAAAMDALGQVHAEVYAQWTQDVTAQLAGQSDTALNFSDAYLRDRAAMLGVWAGAYTRDADVSYRPWLTRATVYEDKASGVSMLDAPNATASVPLDIVRFGANGSGTLEGDYGNDRLYGGGGADTLLGQEGDDRLEGQSGNDNLQGGAGRDTLIGGTEDDTLNGGRDNDQLIGGSGFDTYRFGADFGHDTVIDADGLGVLLDGADPITGGKRVPGMGRVWADEAGRYTFTLVDAAPGRQDLVIGKRGSGAALAGQITVRGWMPGQLGITLQGDELPAPPVVDTLTGGFVKKLEDDGETYVIVGGNYVADGVDAAAQDLIFGGSGADALSGGDGNDGLSGRDGDDDIDGGDGHDLLMGGAGSDRIRGGAGNDHIYGSAWGGVTMPEKTTDAPPAATGVELARGFGWVVYNPPGESGGRDVVTVTADINAVAGDGGNWIDAGEGDDAVAAGSGADVVFGGAGRDKIDGMHGADVLDGGDDDDILYGDGVADPALAAYTPLAAHGDDVLSGGAGADQLIGQGGNDVLYGGIGNDKLFGDQLASLDGLVDDTPIAFHGADVLDGGDGDDYLEGDGGSDRLLGGDGADMLWGDATPDRLDKSAHGDDVLDGGAGNDTLIGGGGHDALYGGDGNDALAGDDEASSALDADAHGNDTLDGGLGNDTLFGGGGHDVLLGGAGDDFLSGDDAIGVDDAGTLAGNDVLEGGAGHDVLVGGQGDDVLLGGDGNDVLAGGAGANVLEGGAGDDQYHVANAGDLIVEAQGGGTDVIVVNLPPPTAALLQATSEANGWSAVQDDTEPNGSVPSPTIVMPDHVEQVLIQGVSDVNVNGNDDANDVWGNGASNAIDGRGGDDFLRGGGGNDRLVGGTGMDDLDGEAGDDAYVVTLGGHTSQGYTQVRATEGTDVLQVVNAALADLAVERLDGTTLRLRGATGDQVVLLQGLTSSLAAVSATDGQATLWRLAGDRLQQAVSIEATRDGGQVIGGTMADTLQIGEGLTGVALSGGRGDDTITVMSSSGSELRMGLQDGVDTVHAVARAGAGVPKNVLQLDQPVALADVRLIWGRDGWHALTVGGAAGLRFQSPGWTVAGNVPLAELPIDVIRYVDGTSETMAAVVARGVCVVPDPTAGNDAVTLTPWADSFNAGAGQDTVNGLGGDDRLFGEAGNDTLNGGSGDDFLDGGADVDTLRGDDGNDTLLNGEKAYGGQGDDWLVRDADGGAFSGGSGRFEGGAGDDTYQIVMANTGSGIVLADQEGNDTLVLPTLSREALSLSAGSFYQLQIGHAQPIYIADWVWSSIDEIQTSTGATTLARLTGEKYLYVVSATSNRDDGRVTGGAAADTLTVRAGDDNVRISGGRGNDTIRVNSSGGTTVLYELGDGLDNITTVARADGARNVVVFGAGIAASDIRLLDYGSGNFRVAVGPVQGWQFTVEVDAETGAPTPGQAPFDEFRFVDGSTLDWAQLVAGGVLPAPPIVGTDGNDTLTGTALGDVIQGLGGNDTLTGAAGNDSLDGGAGIDQLYRDDGNDTLVNGERMYGGNGNDAYVVPDVFGDVEIWDLGGNDSVFDTLVLPASYAPSRISVSRSGTNGQDLVVRPSYTYWTGTTMKVGSGSPIILKNFALSQDGTNRVEVFRFADGTVWSLADILAADSSGYVSSGNDGVIGFGWADAIATGEGDDRVDAYGGDDTLDGGTGADLLSGGAGRDTYRFRPGSGMDIVREQSANTSEVDVIDLGVDPGRVAVARDNRDLVVLIDGGADQIRVENYFTSGSSGHGSTGLSIELLRFADQSTWDGAAISARLPVTAVNSMVGTPGDDSFMIDDARDVVVEQAGAGIDTVTSSVSYRLQDNVENLTATGTLDLWLAGNALGNTLTGNVGNNVLNAARVSTAWWSSAVSLLSGGADTLIGGAGDDVYYVNGSVYGPHALGYYRQDDVILEEAGGGMDTMVFVGSETETSAVLPGHVERLLATNASTLVGNELGNYIEDVNTVTGVTSAAIDGGSGADWMVGGSKANTYLVDDVGDLVDERGFYADGTEYANRDTVRASISYTLTAALEDLILTGSANISGAGNDKANQITGNTGNNLIDGQGGADAMAGGGGDDSYVVDDAGDTVVEAAGGGTDSVSASVSFTLGDNVENLTLTGAANLDGTGNDADNAITGTSGANTLTGLEGNDAIAGLGGDDTLEGGTGDDLLQGGAGNDTLHGGSGVDAMIGGAGDDLYFVDAAGDTTVEVAGEGVDTVRAAISWVLSSEVENLELLGGPALQATGNALANVLRGNAGDNLIDGGAGADSLNGGAGNDTVFEAAGEGVDLVQARISFAIPDHVENLTLLGTAAATVGTGNALDNVITGNGQANTLFGDAGNDWLNGGSGNDTMHGGEGDDTFVVNAGGDVVVELAEQGYDIVRSSVSYALQEHVEELVLTGSGVVDGTGNALDNRLIGNGKNNTLAGGDGHDWIDGLGGIDTMIGGLGDDTYVVNTGSDVVLELEGEGIDTVMSSVSLTLAAHLENLTLIGTANLNGTGDAADNVLLGNAANNVLTGQAGNDRLDGGAGNDTLKGGAGADDYVFGRGWGSDTVQENDATAGVVDRVLLQSGILLSDTSFARNGNNLEVRLSGSADLLVVKDWYLGSRYQVEEFVYADGTVLPGTAINAEAITPSTSDCVLDAMWRPALASMVAGRLPARLAEALHARRGAIAAVGVGDRLPPALGDASLERQLARLVESMAAWNTGAAMDAPSRLQPMPWRQATAEQFPL